MKAISIILASIFLLFSFSSCSFSQKIETSPTETLAGSETASGAETKPENTEPDVMQKYDPKEDSVVNVLMIGNSFCYYYVEELYGMAKAAGVNMKVCNLYYSGCSLQQHWTWWKLNQKNYQYFETDGKGRRKTEKVSLVDALKKENWDVISIQGSSGSFRGDKTAAEEESALKSSYRYLTDLMGMLREQFPASAFYWHHTWSYQVGYDRNGFQVDTVEKQTLMWENAKEKYHLPIAKDFNLIRIPSGDAWQYARQDPRSGDVLCNRGARSDNYHDGDEGGGQYLNACVWLESLTGISCIGNTYRPSGYTLSEDRITALQEAAHRAVEEAK